MNRTWVLQNLRETVDHIQSVITSVELGNDEAFESWIEFIYRDLNRAWNGRNTSDHSSASADAVLRRFPTDISFDD